VPLVAFQRHRDSKKWKHIKCMLTVQKRRWAGKPRLGWCTSSRRHHSLVNAAWCGPYIATYNCHWCCASAFNRAHAAHHTRASTRQQVVTLRRRAYVVPTSSAEARAAAMLPSPWSPGPYSPATSRLPLATAAAIESGSSCDTPSIHPTLQEEGKSWQLICLFQ